MYRIAQDQDRHGLFAWNGDGVGKAFGSETSSDFHADGFNRHACQVLKHVLLLSIDL